MIRLLRISRLIEADDASFARDMALSLRELPEIGFLALEINCPLTLGSQLKAKPCLAAAFSRLVLLFAILKLFPS